MIFIIVVIFARFIALLQLSYILYHTMNCKSIGLKNANDLCTKILLIGFCGKEGKDIFWEI